MSWRAGFCLHEIFLALFEGLARTRAPGPQAAKLSLCTPEKPGRDGKILSDHRQEGNEVHRL